jgi:preprotein translocase subunit SecD
MRKLKKIFTSTRVIIVVVALLLAVFSIYPVPLREGVAIRNVLSNSSAEIAGMISPNPMLAPTKREVVISIDNVPVKDTADFYDKLGEVLPNTTFVIKTNKGEYNLRSDKEIGLVVYDAPTSNIRKGLDLEGGTRVLLQPERILSQDEVGVLIDNMKERLNVYGLSDLIVRESNDLPPPLGSGNQYVLVEIAGATKEEVKDLLAKQGKFEAKIGNDTVFIGGRDIKAVCRSADCAGIDPQTGCGRAGDGIACRFRFSITLSQEAASRQAEATKNLQIIKDENTKEQYLEKQLILFLDDAEVDKLNIGADLKGKAETDIEISGSGYGQSEEAAVLNALSNMKRLQTILLTGSLPIKLEVVKMDTVSAQLGAQFIKNALFMAFTSIIVVALLIFARYRRFKISVAIVTTMLIEIVLLLGAAALIKWNIDLAAVAGIIITVGTAVNDQIIITDETLRKRRVEEVIYDWKERLKRAFFIIMGAYFTVVVAMFPLLTAGAGLLKGFALTTIIGLSVGVFITRPAFGTVIEILLKD